MSGHSKFANIKHKKEKNDAKRGRYLPLLAVRSLWLLKPADRILTTTASFVM